MTEAIADRSIDAIDRAPPRGIHHDRCPLAVVTGDGGAVDRPPGPA